ncbi:MAG TPA: hypothetical protein VNM67_13890 [Thermoanaerobaculia bacterium]|nr:hypothetical protein [Thermoanaerobaculia bacterium]
MSGSIRIINKESTAQLIETSLNYGTEAQMKLAVLALAMFVSSAVVAAEQEADLGLVRRSPAPAIESGADCLGGISYDDGSFEEGYGFATGVFAGTYAMRFDLPGGANRIDAICICWQSIGGAAHDHGLRIWAADGPGGGPGTLLSVLPAASVTGVSAAPKFFRYEIPGGLLVGTSSVYVAPTWAASLFPNRFVCADENGSSTQPGFVGVFGAASNPDIKPTDQLGSPTIFPNYRNLGVRVEAVATSACVPSSKALCLNHGRFRVEATYRTAAGQEGTADVVKLTDETGYLWFFNSSNVEAVVKVLDACALNGKFWIFAGGLTDVLVHLTVTDGETGNFKTYTNPQGKPFQPIQDTAALPCN